MVLYPQRKWRNRRQAYRGRCTLFAMSLMTECHRWSEQALFNFDDAAHGAPEEMQLQAPLRISFLFTHGSTEVARVAMFRGLAIAEDHEDART